MGIFANFTVVQDNKYKKFKEISCNFLESFRVLNLSPPNIQIIINSYFFSMGYMKNDDSNLKLVLFFKVLGNSFENNMFFAKNLISDNRLKGINNNKSFKKILQPTLNTIINILLICRNYLLNRKSEEIELVNLLYMGIDNYYNMILPSSYQNLIHKLFTSIFIEFNFASFGKEMYIINYCEFKFFFFLKLLFRN